MERIKIGDLVVVNRRGEESAGVVSNIDMSQTGNRRIFVNSGGFVEMVHDGEHVELVPEDLKEAVLAGLVIKRVS